MAQIFKAQPKKTQLPSSPIEVEVESLDHLGQGVARYKGRPLFIAGALPSERVQVRLTSLKRKLAEARLLSILTPSPQRIEPHCSYFNRCGGCSLQMLNNQTQIALKQQNVQQLFTKFAGTTALDFEPPLCGDAKGYRRRARLHVLFHRKTNQLTFGFKRRNSRELIEIETCPTLVPPLSKLIVPLRDLFHSMKARRQLGHIELYMSEACCCVYLRLTAALNQRDQQALLDFAQQQKINLTVKVADEPIQLITGKLTLSYCLKTDDKPLTMRYTPGDFIQVNEVVNQKMVQQAIEWLELQPTDRVLDLFCGIGNFSLPLASHCAHVIGIEGVDNMVAQAQQNALNNGIANIEFMAKNLDETPLAETNTIGSINKILLDPARAGALMAMAEIVNIAPERVLYVSCDPATLARDSKILLDAGYQLTKIGLMDMFPDTEHIETMVLFTKPALNR